MDPNPNPSRSFRLSLFLTILSTQRSSSKLSYTPFWHLACIYCSPAAGNSVIHLDKYGYGYYIKLRSEREMKLGAGNFVTRGILLLIFVTNRILLESILSPTISSISHVILMRLNLSVFLTTSFTTIYFVIFTSLTNL